ncbi:MAG: methylmalonyl Co-A mutase-associated GTPase MeaB [Candidatus Bathyarchaeota archaeon]|nr:MAG: methylmalonyl Co-A mutase-associated GTPase MeaB [Candidatus Bathyarchaeota archaeon]
MSQFSQLVSGVLKGERKSIARIITLIEDNPLEAQQVMSKLYPYTGNAQVLGVTGPTGSGKSTLIQGLVEALRKDGKRVGVIAVDPSSPFTGGAFLGDRIRMQKLSTDKEVFIRSMASRASLGGIAKATRNAVRVLDASGKDVVIVETVGAGQSEVDIIKVADTVVVVLAPGMGDDIQAIKAGIMEIGDIFAVNKSDRENADEAVIDIETMLNMAPEKQGWRPPVVKIIAIKDEGITELLDLIDQHSDYLKTENSETQRRQQAETELFEAIIQKMTEAIKGELKHNDELEKLILQIMMKKIDPYSAADLLLEGRLKGFKKRK